MQKKISLGVALFLVIFTMAFLGEALAQLPIFEKGFPKRPEARYTPGEIIVKFKPGVSDNVIRALNQRQGCSVLSKSRFAGFKRLRIPKGRTVEEMVEIYGKDPNVEYAEPNYTAHALLIPNDPLYSYQWHMDNNVYGGINMQSAWDLQTGIPGVVVAVIDTGVAFEDYIEAVPIGRSGRYRYVTYARAPDLAATNFVPGYDFVNNDTHPNDDEGHGTHVAGTIAQSTNNGLGVAGVAFNCSIMPVKVLDASGSGTYAAIADGIYFAANNGAHVINMSLGGSSPSITLENALAHAYGRGVTIVCAAGNEGPGGTPSYPAAYDGYCIAVGATRYDENVSYYSTTGSYVDLAAPGGDLTVDQNGDGYGDGVLQETHDGTNYTNFGYWFYQGTSMATPHVAGVAALLIANGTTGPGNVREALESTAEDHGAAGWDEAYGWGIVDACAALSYMSRPVHDVAVSDIEAPAWGIKGDSIDVTVTVVNPGNFDETFTVTLTDTTDVTTISSTSVTLAAGQSTSLSFTWHTTTSTLGDHILKAEASTVAEETNTDNNTATTTVIIREPSHDVAITAIDAPLEAVNGDSAVIDVTVENQGTYAGITTVTLTDTTAGVQIGSQAVPLAAGTSTAVSFNWDTAGSTIGDHILEATASIVPSEIDTGDNSMSVTVRIVQPANMHVASIDMRLKIAGINTSALATVTIVDAGKQPVEGATVYGSWSGATSDADSAITGVNGQITVESNRVKRASSGTTFTFTVDNVVKDGWTYNSGANVETSDSIRVP
ncbi:MAG: S8 family serine peptidase [Thermodesulfobacteriota bacterium]